MHLKTVQVDDAIALWDLLHLGVLINVAEHAVYRNFLIHLRSCVKISIDVPAYMDAMLKIISM